MKTNQNTLIENMLGSQILMENLTQMLDLSDIINLLLLNKTIYEKLRLTQIISKIFYETFLIEKSTMLSMLYNTQHYQNFKSLRLKNILTQFEDNPLGSIIQFKKAKSTLFSNLCYFISEQNCKLIVNDIFQQIISPTLYFPQVRKQTMGEYCISPLQVFMSKLFVSDQSLRYTSYFYFKLKQILVQNQFKLQQNLRQNKQILLEYRLFPELIQSNIELYHCPFLEIIKSLFSIFDLYLQSVQNYFKQFSNYPQSQFLLEFLRRYNAYINMVLALQDKLGFIFDIFTNHVNNIQPQYLNYPKCSIWKTLVRKWVLKMKNFQPKIQQGFIKLLVKSRQDNIKKYILNQFNISSQSHGKSKYYTVIMNEFINDKQIVQSEQINIISKIDSSLILVFLCEYMEYLVDISCNEYSVHWCDHSDHQLGTYYQQTQAFVISSTKQFYSKCISIFGINSISQQLLTQDIMFLKQILKPTTLSKIIKYSKNLMKQLSNSTIENILLQFQNKDHRIQMINYRNISKNVKSESKQLFDLDKCLFIQKVFVS